MICTHFRILGSPLQPGGKRQWHCTKCLQEFIPKPLEEKTDLSDLECEEFYKGKFITGEKQEEVFCTCQNVMPEHERCECDSCKKETEQCLKCNPKPKPFPADDWKEAYGDLLSYLVDYIDHKAIEDLRKRYLS